MFRLALHLGCTVQELSRRLSYREFRMWMEYYELEPFGIETTDIFHADWVQQFVNMHRDTKKRPKPYPLGDFLLFTGAKPRIQSKRQQPRMKKVATKPLAATPEGAVVRQGGAKLSDETLTFMFLYANPKDKKLQ